MGLFSKNDSSFSRQREEVRGFYPDANHSEEILSGKNCDNIMGAQGEFGYDKNNPIPVNGLGGEFKYLYRLRCPCGESQMFHRLTSTENIHNTPIDIYEMVCSTGKHWNLLYFDMYHPRRSRKIPKGYAFFPYKEFTSMIPIPWIGSNDFVDNFPLNLPDNIRLNLDRQVPEFRRAMEKAADIATDYLSKKEFNFIRPDKIVNIYKELNIKLGDQNTTSNPIEGFDINKINENEQKALKIIYQEYPNLNTENDPDNLLFNQLQKIILERVKSGELVPDSVGTILTHCREVMDGLMSTRGDSFSEISSILTDSKTSEILVCMAHIEAKILGIKEKMLENDCDPEKGWAEKPLLADEVDIFLELLYFWIHFIVRMACNDETHDINIRNIFCSELTKQVKNNLVSLQIIPRMLGEPQFVNQFITRDKEYTSYSEMLSKPDPQDHNNFWSKEELLPRAAVNIGRASKKTLLRMLPPLIAKLLIEDIDKINKTVPTKDFVERMYNLRKQ